ncbi:hypothetical protein CSA08_01020 [Candidatus Gracilibacteria bacterium]|nr:MAG: hypothetical protein CSA08_01020 [Candidatus Gracilibacteria bacterium]
MESTIIIIYTILFIVTYIFIVKRLSMLNDKHYEHIGCNYLKKSNKLVVKLITFTMLVQYIISVFIIITLL